MPNYYIAPFTPMMRSMSVSRPHSRLVLRLHSVMQPPVLCAHFGVRKYSIFKDWKGSTPEDHSHKRSEKGDTEDIHSEASASARRERVESHGIADDSISQAITERGGTKREKQAKEEHPKAPEPVIGMNDERQKK
ncbi:hypothetical protein N7457_000335 [Penicillium paradoxum]|uniref:uncharacterized protein n=1 Tax=Penicillium paradoxum TaxID=176176 RepID=UPI0025469881|nr:uncharacterized protein N7457_000335 [Penicillium paradoxum]KAJ5793736.1 hypothetical protein N7457_000335 [Penicillium paradoxum]